jgi:RNA polymerase sigma-70 factor (ECF subfamily)
MEPVRPSAEESYRRYCGGDSSAFDPLMEEFQQGLISFLFGYVHDWHMAEDLAEDTFAELIIHRDRYRFQSSFKTYLFSVARHKAIDHLRQKSRRGTVGLEEVAELEGDLQGPEEMLLSEERQQAVRQTLQQLPPEQREVLRLLYREQLRYEEAAAVMGKSKKQVDNLAYRAKQTLRGALRKEDLF